MAAPAPCVLGVAPHSGWAAAVILGGTVAAPRVLARERIELADASMAGSRHPYHALAALPPAEARPQLERYEQSAAQLAHAAVEHLRALAREGGAGLAAVGILDSSGRSAASLEVILGSHALIHSAEGHHFRAALAQAAAAGGLGVTRIQKRELSARAQAALGRTEGHLSAAVTALGRGLGAPWGADQKSAVLLAWLLLQEAP